MRKTFTSLAFAAMASLGLALTPLPAAAQMREIDPSNMQIDSDLDNPAPPPVTSTPPTDKFNATALATGVRRTRRVRLKGDGTAPTPPATTPATAVTSGRAAGGERVGA